MGRRGQDSMAILEAGTGDTSEVAEFALIGLVAMFTRSGVGMLIAVLSLARALCPPPQVHVEQE